MIGLIDVDSKIPNLALMKISAYYKSLDEKVEFVKANTSYEKIYASCIFQRNKSICEKLKFVYKDKIEIGGTGWNYDLDKNGNPKKIREDELSLEIEKMKPDYDLYTYEYWLERLSHEPMHKVQQKIKARYLTDVGIGFTKRGCPNKCPFCFVPKKEPCEYEDMKIQDIINPRSDKLILLDNNFSQDINMIDKCKEIIDRGLEVDLCQGVNIRIMDDQKAYWLSKLKHTKQLHIAWDSMNDEKRVMQGLKVLSKYMSLRKVMCYVLVGYNTTLEEDLYRIYKLQELKVDPYVMSYNQRNDKFYVPLEKWCNSTPPVRKVVKFEDYIPYKKWQEKQKQINIFELIN